MNKTLTTKQGYVQNSIIPQLKALINDGLESWAKAGQLITEAIDKHDSSITEIAEIAGLPPKVIATLEKVGRGQILPSLLIATYPAASALPRLPYSEQKKAVEDGVELLLDNGDTLLVRAENLQPEQVNQCINGGSIRTIAAQKAWMEERNSKNALRNAKPVNSPYNVKGGKVYINGACELTRKDLMRMLNEIES